MAALWERLDAALFMLSSGPLSLTLKDTGTHHPRSACFSPHLGRGETNPLVSFEIRRKMYVQEHDSRAGLLGPVQSVSSQI